MTPCEVCGTPCGSKYSVCRENEECRREYQRRVQRKYVDANQDAVRERARERYRSNPEDSRERRRRRRQENPEQERAADRVRYRDNAEQERAAGRAYYQANRDVILERARIKRDEELARRQEYYEAHPEEACEICGGPCGSEYGVCSRTPECKREQKRRQQKRQRDTSPEMREREALARTERRRSHPERERESVRRWKKANPEKVAATTRRFRQRNREKLSAQAKERYQADRVQILERNDASRAAMHSTVKGTAKLLFLGARARARTRGLPFDLTAEWVESELALALENGCPLLGIEITLKGDIGPRSPDSPSIDRFRPELGYVQANCWVLSWAANNMKHDMTLDFVRKVVALADTRFRGVA